MEIVCDRIHDSLYNNSYIWLDYIELRTRLNKFEMFEEHWKMSVLEENNVVLDEKIVEGKTCINRESKSLELTI